MPPHDSVSYLGHASVLLELAGARFLTDPVLRDRLGPLRRRSSPVPPRAFASIDAVLISHLHLDHLDLPSLRRLPRDVPVLVPGGGGGALVRRQGFGRVYEIAAGETVELAGVEVTALPAEHSRRRRPGPWSAEADALGFVIAGACRVYFAGDTDVFAGMAEIAPVDVALLPVWGWGATLGPGHMDPEAAARALALLRPRIAVPIHWGTLFPIGLARWRSDRLTEPPHAFARHAARLAPEVQVRILEPGATLDLREALA